jgi:hypothetical protein
MSFLMRGPVEYLGTLVKVRERSLGFMSGVKDWGYVCSARGRRKVSAAHELTIVGTRSDR